LLFDIDSNRRNTMSTRITIAAAAIMVLIVPAYSSAQAPKAHMGAEHPQQWDAKALSGAYAAARQSSRAKRSARQVAQATGASIYPVTSPDGRLVGADPDAAIRFELRRDPNLCRY
jgi:hypothetical protein